ncbi:MAG: glycosyltransferase family 2 protein [Candidatus Magnetomorum sp.]|nr:glycosyltransferase family 2 protein [Candidatus Magnetomorum sp.]
MKKISVITPVYNQVSIIPSNVPKIISAMDSCGHPYEILLINDGSTDGSDIALQAFNHPFVKIIEKKNQGLGSVLKLGFSQMDGDLLIIIDLDLSYDIQNISRIIDLSTSWDCVVCSKYARLNNYPLHRKMLSFLHHWFCTLLFEIPVRDMGSGIVMLHSKFVRNQPFISNGFGIHCEFFLTLHRQQASILEIPVLYTHFPGSYRLIYHSLQTIKELGAIVQKYYPLFLISYIS